MAVRVHLLGTFQVDVDGRVVGDTAFARRAAISLVSALALAPHRRLHREQLLDLLWPQLPVGDAANQLHKAAHYARRATGAADCVTLRHQVVSLFPGRDVTVDAQEVERAATAALGDDGDDELRAVRKVLDTWPGELLPDDPYASWAVQPRQRLQLLHRELLRRAGRWAELVAADPTDEEAHLGVARDLLAEGDRAGALRQLDTLEDVLADELGIGPSPEAHELRALAIGDGAGEVRTAKPRHASLAMQQVRFASTADGVRLAYAVSGHGPPLVKASTWLTHLDYDWASPVWSHWWQALSDGHTLVRYDERGCGLSDWDVDASSYTLDAWVRDLETVVDTLGLERFPLLGISQGGPIALTYAARHPERVSHVIVLGTCARSPWFRADADERRALTALGELIRVSWGSDQPGFRTVYDAKFLPDGPLETWRAFDELQRRSTSAENAYRLWRAFGGLDAGEAARSLDVPTLILHARRDQVWRFEEAEELHELVRGSRLVPLDSANHILQADEPAFGAFLDELRAFLRTP